MLEEIIKNCNKDLEEAFRRIEKIEEFNSEKILNAFIENSICETDFNSATGYGYNDSGRDK
ncbi:MAG: methionine gamma-lyase family protein, partial [Bacilli bacterium]|nr:methionine gamma-lyase family protein [Bacilli bacterium]